MNKVREVLGYLSGLCILILAALLFRQKKATEGAQSALAHEQKDTAIKLNDNDREIAAQHADKLVSEYERLKNASNKE